MARAHWRLRARDHASCPRVLSSGSGALLPLPFSPSALRLSPSGLCEKETAASGGHPTPTPPAGGASAATRRWAPEAGAEWRHPRDTRHRLHADRSGLEL